jgi:hypothetical protein
VFTIPRELRCLWGPNAKCFGDLLLRAAGDTLLELLADDKYLGARPGIILALHTWNQQLGLHLHVHALVTGGGWSVDGRWLSTRKGWLLPQRVLLAKYRGKLRALLLEALEQGELRAPSGIPAARVRSRLNRFGVQRAHVKVLEQYAYGRGVVTYLSRYLTGGPISNRRLVSLAGGCVTFRYQDRRELDVRTGRYKVRYARLSVADFLQRWSQHIPPKRFVMVRYRGLYATSKGDELNAARRALGQSDCKSVEPASWAELAQRLGFGSAARCPICGGELLCVREDDGRARPPPSWRDRWEGSRVEGNKTRVGAG